MGRVSRRKQIRRTYAEGGAPALAIRETAMGRGSRRNSAKLSLRLLEVVEPFCDDEMPLDARRAAITAAAAAWNVASAPRELQSELLESVITESHDPDLIAVMLALIERKLALYPEDRRMVGNFDLVQDGEDVRLVVAGMA
jgi:hypothetical protein